MHPKNFLQLELNTAELSQNDVPALQSKLIELMAQLQLASAEMSNSQGAFIRDKVNELMTIIEFSSHNMSSEDVDCLLDVFLRLLSTIAKFVASNMSDDNLLIWHNVSIAFLKDMKGVMKSRGILKH